MTRRAAATDGMGHDAFLDIVANLVGILIILVVILGSQSTGIMGPSDAATQTQPEVASTQQLETIAQSMLRAEQARRDSARLEQRIKEYDQSLAEKRAQRGMLLDLVAIAKEAWEKQKTNFEASRVAAAELDARRVAAEKQLADLALQQQSLEQRDPPTIEFEHLPTPMAKAVFNEEIHVRLKDGKLSIVPLTELIAEMKRQIQSTGMRGRDGQSLDSVGPIRGYIAKYVTDRQKGFLQVQGQRRLGVQTSLVSAVMEPLEPDAGQSIGQVLEGRSALEVEIAGRDPRRTTITAWVYPESFGEFAQLKRYLYRRGFATAARPLKRGIPIGVSPRGSRSAAQ